MRTHAEIIDRPTRFARALGADTNRVKAWKRGDSIPAAYWSRVRRAGLATLEELANAAEAKAGANRVEDIAQTAPDLIEPNPAKPGSALRFRAFMLNSPWANFDWEPEERAGRERDVSKLFEDE